MHHVHLVVQALALIVILRELAILNRQVKLELLAALIDNFLERLDFFRVDSDLPEIQDGLVAADAVFRGDFVGDVTWVENALTQE